MALLLVDAPSLYFRAFFAVPPIQAPDGTPVNAVRGFVDFLARLVADRDPDRMACVMDYDWRPRWRVDLLPSYKAHRADEGGEPDDLSPQVPILAEVMEAAGVAVIGLDGYEADDVIATLAAREPPPVEIVTGDRDLFQLVRDPEVRVLYPRRGVSVMETVDEAWVAERYGIPGRAYADFAILRGDPSDGLPGVPGIGAKTAAALLARYGSLEALCRAAAAASSGPLARVRDAAAYLEAAMRVVRLPAELDLPPADLTRPHAPPDPARLDALARRWGIEGPVRRLAAALAAQAPGR